MSQLVAANSNILLIPVSKEGLFSGATEYYEVAYSETYKPKQKIYLYPGDYPTIKIDAIDYTIAKEEDVLGCLNG